MMSASKANIRFERADRKRLGLMRGHVRREIGDVSHVDESRSHMNRVLVGDDILDGVERRLSDTGATIHGNTREPFVLGIVTTSPKFFEGDGGWDWSKVNDWISAVDTHLRERFGDDLAWSNVDLDEKTPHINFALCPVNKRTTKRGRVKHEVSVSSYFPHKDSFSREQDALAESLSDLGISRGVRGSRATHLRPREMKDREARRARETMRDCDASDRALEIGADAVLSGFVNVHSVRTNNDTYYEPSDGPRRKYDTDNETKEFQSALDNVSSRKRKRSVFRVLEFVTRQRESLESKLSEIVGRERRVSEREDAVSKREDAVSKREDAVKRQHRKVRELHALVESRENERKYTEMSCDRGRQRKRTMSR